MQTICTSFQTDNHINTSSLDFYRPDALPDAQPTVSQQIQQKVNIYYYVHAMTFTCQLPKLTIKLLNADANKHTYTQWF